MNTDVENRLREFAQKLGQHNQGAIYSEYADKLLFGPVMGGWGLSFYGFAWDEPFEWFLQLLTDPEVAAEIVELDFGGPDKGGNGTCEWDFAPLLSSPVTFPRLHTLSMRMSAPEDHNQQIVRWIEPEQSDPVTLWLGKAPVLESLRTPSAPSIAFFERAEHPLAALHLDAGESTQDFILNLSRSSCFPELRMLNWGEYSQHYMDGYQKFCTPFEHFAELFGSQALGPVNIVVLRNTILSVDQLKQLQRMRPDKGFKAFQAQQWQYVNYL